MKYITVILCTVAFLSSLNAKQPEQDADGLVKAMPAYYYERTLPSELKEGEPIYLSLLYPGGRIHILRKEAGSEFKAGNKVRLYVFLRPKNTMVYMRSGFANSVVVGFPTWVDFSPSQKIEGGVDDYIIRFSSDGSFVPGHKPWGSNYDLILATEEKMR